MSDCETIRTELGAYALGQSDPHDRRRVDEHLATCPRCRAELDDLRGATLVLRGLAPDDADPHLAAPSADRIMSSIADARRRERRRLRGALAGAGALAAMAAVLGVVLSGRPVDPLAPDGPAVAMLAQRGGDGAATVRLSSRPWGTQVDLRAERLPTTGSGDGYAVWLVRADGRRVPAGTFRPASGSARSLVRLAAAVPLSEVAEVGVSRAADDVAVLRAPIS